MMTVQRGVARRGSPPVMAGAGAPARQTSAQIIGLLKARTSGITLSRHAYADVLRTIYADLADVQVQDHSVTSRLNVWAARPLSPLVLDEMGQHKRAGLNVWCFVCESDVLPDRSLEACANADQVWVPTTFVRDVCLRGGMPPGKVHVVPYYLPPAAASCRRRREESPFRVLVSWDGRSSPHRKNVLGSIAAFQAAWPRSRKVVLRLKTRDLRDDHRAEIVTAIGNDDRIILDERTVDTVDEIYAGADVLLHLHRAEGYGRHIVEAMQRGIPVITTDYSGPCAWCRPDNCWLVPAASMVSTQVQTEYQYPQGGVWAEPSIGIAARWLRAVQQQPREAASRAMRAMADMVEYASLENSRRAMLAAIAQLPGGAHV